MSARAAFRRLAALLLLLVLVACAKPVPAEQTQFVGHWRGDGMLLVIAADGRAVYERVRRSGRTSIDGPLHDITTRGFRIGVGPLSARFKVQHPPKLIDGQWRMTVDGVELTRFDLDPVDPGNPRIEL